ncbi:hypothetical protein K504DRAFT_363389, partial [Pleomassaria siparia CBS 279.74]
IAGFACGIYRPSWVACLALWWKWRENCSTSGSSIVSSFLPALMNSIAGLVSTLVNV